MAQISPLKDIFVFLAHGVVILIPCTMIFIKTDGIKILLKSCSALGFWVSCLGSLISSLVSSFNTHTNNKCIPNTIHIIMLSLHIFDLTSSQYMFTVQRGPDCYLCNQKLSRLNYTFVIMYFWPLLWIMILSWKTKYSNLLVTFANLLFQNILVACHRLNNSEYYY